MKKIFTVMVITIVFVLDLLASGGKKSEKLVINACGITRVAFIKELARGFMKKYKIPVALNKKGGVIGAINATYNKKSHIGVGCRILFNKGIEKDMSYMQVAWGALAFIVNENNPIEDITLDQAKKILTGKIRNWKELGGEDKRINLYTREAGNRTGVGYSVRKIVLGSKNKKLFQPSNTLFRKSSGGIRKAVINDRYGFGVGDVMSAKRVKGLKILKLNGVIPTKKAILEQKYLGFRPYFFYFPEEITDIAKKFRDYALTPEGQAIISKAGTANLDEGLASLDEGIADGENMVKLGEKNDDEEIDPLADQEELKMFACGITRVSFIRELNGAFSKKYNVHIPLNKKGGVPFVLNGLFEKKVTIGAGCRKPFKNKKEKKLWFTQVGWGALGFIVNEKNPIDNITTENIKKVLTGKIKNWKELGGEDKPIKLCLRKGKGSGVGSTAREILFKDKNKNLYKKATFFKSSGPIRKAIIKDIYAFGIDDVTSSKRVKGIKILKVDGISANKSNILSKKYPLRRPFFLYMNQKPNGLTKKYVDFALSKEGQHIISKAGTANLEEATGKNDKMNLIFQKLKFNIKSR